jgi:serine/threonine-protein kinase
LDLSRFKVAEEVGRGSLGQVYRAQDRQTGRDVAIKILNPELQADANMVGIFQKEMMLLQDLQHPNLVGLVDYCLDPPNYYLATEFIDGWSVRQWLEYFGRVPPLVAVAVGIQIVAALDHLHLRDLIHADLSAANIMIRKDGRVLVTDLGLASDVANDRYRYELVGTAGYYSPEHVTQNPIGPQSDLYCVGLLLFEMLTGRKAIYHARSADSQKDIVSSMKQPQLEMIRCADAKMESILRRLIQYFLQFRTPQRIRSAEEALHGLRRFLLLYGITDPQRALQRFMVDGKMLPTDSDERDVEASEQDIYYGHLPYTIEDLALLRRSVS